MDNKDLIHRHNSRIYDNFLMHWKYAKREKIVGAKKKAKTSGNIFIKTIKLVTTLKVLSTRQKMLSGLMRKIT